MKIFKLKDREVWHIIDESDEYFQSTCRAAQYQDWRWDREKLEAVPEGLVKGAKVKYYEGEKLCSTCVSRAYTNGIVEIQEVNKVDEKGIQTSRL